MGPITYRPPQRPAGLCTLPYIVYYSIYYIWRMEKTCVFCELVGAHIDEVDDIVTKFGDEFGVLVTIISSIFDYFFDG